MRASIWDGDVLLGKTLPEAQALCPGKHFIVRETNGRFAEGEPRIVRARSLGDSIEVVTSRFKDIE